MAQPSVDILLSTWNGEKFLASQLDSLLAQDYPVLRVLVRDTDGPANGQYKNRLLDVPVKAENIDKTNAGGWNQGTFSTKIDIELESK